MTTASEILEMREAVVAEARTWMEPHTPFHHQARVKGVGVDCISYVWAVGEAARAMRPVTEAQARPFWRFYGGRPKPKVMERCLVRFLRRIPKADAMAGDITWSHWGNEMPIHMAILAEFDGRPSVIHAVDGHGVAEHTLFPEFLERVTSYWRYPVIAGESIE